MKQAQFRTAAGESLNAAPQQMGATELEPRPVADEKTKANQELQAPAKEIRKKWDFSPLINCFLWLFAMTYALMRFATSPINNQLPRKDHMKFEAGMYGISRLQDMSDGEYTFGRLFIEKYWFYVLLQPIISQTLFRKHPQYLPHFYACYSIAFITWNLYWESTFIHLVQFACFYAAGYLRSKVLCYVFMFAMVGHTHYVTGDPFYVSTSS